MHDATPIERMRAAVAGQLLRYGVRDATTMRESILIHNGLFCGRKFQCEGHEVVWFLEEDEIKFFGPCGDLLKSTSAIACLQELDSQSAEHTTDGTGLGSRKAA